MTGHPSTTASNRRAPRETLGRHLLLTVMNAAQVHRFRHAPGLRVVIEAPAPAWVEPLRFAAVTIADWDVAEALEGTPGGSRETAAAEERIAQALGAGHRIVAVSHAPGRHLPPALVACADMSVRTGHPPPAVIRKAIRDATGVEPGTTSGRLGDRLDFFDLVSSIQAGSDVRTCLRRLGSATANRAVVDRFPARDADLANLNGYGAAAAWASRLVADIEAWRLREIVDFPTPNRQTLLVGPHGTGKRTLVASIARSAGLPLVEARVASWSADGASCPDGGLRRAEAVYCKAVDAAPAILLLDGIDAIPTVGPGDTDGRDAVVMSVRRLLDAIAPGGPASPKLIVIATARFGGDVDPALVRPGRFARVIDIPPPDEMAIPGILLQHLEGDLDGVDLVDVCALASGSTGATIAGWVRAARRRARIEKRPMMIRDLVMEASAPENRSPGSLLRAEVWETFGAGEGHGPRSRPARPSLGKPAGGLAERPRIPSPPGKVARSGIVSKARIVSVLAGRAPGTTTGSKERTGVHDPGKGK